MIPSYVIGAKGDACQCGRRITVRHCPECGSTRKYGYATPQYRPKIDTDGKQTFEQVQLYRCIECNYKYTDAEREFCGAPPIGVAMARAKTKALALNLQTDNAPAVVQVVAEAKGKDKQSKVEDPIEAYHAFRRVEFQIIREYKDEEIILKQQGKTMNQTQEEYVESNLTAMGLKRVPDPTIKENT